MNWKFWKQKESVIPNEGEVVETDHETGLSYSPDYLKVKKETEVENMAKEVLLKTDIKRDKGFLYYCGTDNNGNITVVKVPMARGRKKAKK